MRLQTELIKWELSLKNSISKLKQNSEIALFTRQAYDQSSVT